MAAVAFDSLQYAHQLEAAGMSREQAEVVAKGLTTMFIHNFDSLVTKDYLDLRFSEFETRIVANLDGRFADFRLEIHQELGDLRSTQKLQSWMLGLLVAGMLLPVVERLVGGM